MLTEESVRTVAFRVSIYISLTLTARISGRRCIGYGKEAVYEEGRYEGVPGSSVDGGGYGLEGSALF